MSRTYRTVEWVDGERSTIGRLAKGQRSSATPPSDPESFAFPPKPGDPTISHYLPTPDSGLGAAPDRLVK